MSLLIKVKSLNATCYDIVILWIYQSQVKKGKLCGAEIVFFSYVIPLGYSLKLWNKPNKTQFTLIYELSQLIYEHNSMNLFKIF